MTGVIKSLFKHVNNIIMFFYACTIVLLVKTTAMEIHYVHVWCFRTEVLALSHQKHCTSNAFVKINFQSKQSLLQKNS
jgi:hypothetical protein